MKQVYLFPLIFLCFFNLLAQVQVSSFTYENVDPIPPSNFIQYNGLMYFDASSDGYGKEIWHSDGTTANTVLLKDINPNISYPIHYTLSSNAATLNGELYFIAYDGTSDGEIWKTDGTSEGTVQVTDFVNGRAFPLSATDSYVFFLVLTETDILQVWKTDGTLGGTALVKELAASGNGPSYVGVINNVFIFTFQSDGFNTCKVWRSDGTTDGTYAITGELLGNGSGYFDEGDSSGFGGTTQLSQYIKYNNKLFFVSDSYLHATNETIDSSSIISSIWSTTEHLEFSDVIEFNGKLYFLFYSHDSHQLRIWESNGTNSGTYEIYNGDGFQYFFTSHLSTYNNSIIFCGKNEMGGSSILSLDVNTYQVTELVEINDQPEEPSFFWNGRSNCNLYEMGDGHYFLMEPTALPLNNFGWEVDLLSNTAIHQTELDNIWEAFIYNEELYYSKDFQVWKFNEGLSTESIAGKLKISLFPNPTSDYFTIDTGNSLIQKVKLIDINGKVVLNLNGSSNSNLELSLSSLSKGMYFVNVQTDSGCETVKVVKQ